jgi:microcin C transport system permease protein
MMGRGEESRSVSPFIEWNPITLKRWRRFRNLRRAWYSFWILLFLYGLSLASELLCNQDPLYVRFEGRSYFPVFRFYPETTFMKNGILTLTDYKRLRKEPCFADHPGHVMVFPVIPFGPNEIIDPDSVAAPDRVTLSFRPRLSVATVDLHPDLTIARSVGAAPFFDRDDDGLRGRAITNTWRLPPALHDALRQRFRNESAPACSFVLQPGDSGGRPVEGSFSEFTPRAAVPGTARLTLREVAAQGVAAASVVISPSVSGPENEPPLWQALDPATRSTLTRLAIRSLTEAVTAPPVTIQGTTLDVHFERTGVHWPHPPTRGHWLGIDTAGRDVLARILYGLRTSMTFGFLLVGLSMGLGTLFGALQGYYGGKVDMAGQRFTEIWSALPFLYVMILLGAIYGRGFMLLALCYALFNWIGISYYIRAEFLRLRRLPFVEAARALGLPHRKIMIRHILPNALVPLITFFPFYLVGAIGALAALDYLGFGLPPPTASWGELMQQAQQFRWAWWLILYPSLALFAVMLLSVFVGEGVRNAYDPRPQVRIE